MPKVIASYYGYQKWEGYMPLYNAPLWGSEAHQIIWFHEAFGGLCRVCCRIVQMRLFFTHVQRIHFLWVLQNAHFSKSNIKNIWSTPHKSTCTLLGSFVRQIQQDNSLCRAATASDKSYGLMNNTMLKENSPYFYCSESWCFQDFSMYV
jgi:hypothetical protein